MRQQHVRTIVGGTLGAAIALVLAVQVGTAQRPQAQAGQTDSKATAGKDAAKKEPAAKPRATARNNSRLSVARPSETDSTLCADGCGGCVAPVSVEIKLPKANLHMKTEEPAVWYSLVDTIPPVGHTASVALNPVRLIADGRAVGTLESGVVKFREVVRDVALTGSTRDNASRLAALMNEMRATTAAKLNRLSPIDVRQYELPEAGVQVMRARVEETYTIDGIGRDTVELNGWIAVRHGAPRPALGENSVEWGSAVLDTEFVGMSLSGESKVFGPVQITLDTSKPALGQVGKLDIPEFAKIALAAELQKHDLVALK